MKKKKFFWIFTILIIILVGLRLALPYALLHYAEYRINKIPEYQVKIADLDVHLYRGSYTIKNIALHKISKKIPVPFFSADAVDLAVEWKALLHGSVVAQIFAIKPTINFVLDPNGKNDQVSINKEWENAVKALFPLNFNKVEAVDGRIYLHSYSGKPPFHLYLRDAKLKIENMQIADRSDKKLPSVFQFSAKTKGNADVILNGKFNPFTSQPTFYMTGEVKSMEIKEANDLLKHYTAADVSDGNFSLYIEAAAAKGKIDGYAKPIIKNLKILDPEKPMGPVEALYKGALEIISKIITNPQKDTIATKIHIKGNIDDPDTSILSILGNLISHAFIQALLPGIDHTVQMRDVIIGKQRSGNNSKS